MTDHNFGIVLNGSPAQIDPQESLGELLTRLDLHRRPVAVEVNGDLVPRERHSAFRLAAGDVVEIVTLVGGG